uniref:Uncharacterized protein n=1 Tax=Panthera tigris altaica TaxID=74533 RepID=A0A8C9KI99_PANTA
WESEAGQGGVEGVGTTERVDVPQYMSQSKHTEARELMCSGALLFFSHGQVRGGPAFPPLLGACGLDKEVCVCVVLENLAKLFSLMDPNSPERVAFVSRALKWSSGGSGKLGHPRLHQLLALTLWKGRRFLQLEPTPGEERRVNRVAKATGGFLCLKNKSSASVVFTTYTQKHPSIENGPPFVQPLLNFIWFLLLAVDGMFHLPTLRFCPLYTDVHPLPQTRSHHLPCVRESDDPGTSSEWVPVRVLPCP